jgi:hypothetical protein
MAQNKEEMEAAILAKQTENIDQQGYKWRLAALVPFNAMVFMGTLKYCRNVNRISKRFIPASMRKVTVRNLVIVSTV